MEYLHDLLNEMSVDFRIIRDEGGLGRFADWEDIEKIESIEEVTVFFSHRALALKKIKKTLKKQLNNRGSIE